MRLEEIERETVEKEELKIKKESELAEAKEREIQFAAERSEAKYQEMLKNTAGKVLKDPPEKVELPPWPPLPPLPVIPEKKNVEVPGEPTGTGVNKKVKNFFTIKILLRGISNVFKVILKCFI